MQEDTSLYPRVDSDTIQFGRPHQSDRIARIGLRYVSVETGNKTKEGSSLPNTEGHDTLLRRRSLYDI